MSPTTPDPTKLSAAEKDALIQSQAAQLREALARIAALEARLAALPAPAKTPDNSSLPPSKGHKPNRPDKPKPKGPRLGSLGRKGGGRALCGNPDETVTAKPVRCHCCNATFGEDDHTLDARYDKIQAIGTTAPDLPPQPGSHPTFARDHEYKRHGTLSLLAGIDLLTGQVHASIEDRHRSREFVGFLEKLDAAYPADTAIKVILDNQPEGRFSFVFTPKHGSWLNLVEGFFSKMARSMLRHIRVQSKAELKARILA